MSREIARKVLEIESRAILELLPRIDAGFDRAVEILLACAGRVVVTGMGKSGLIGQKVSATLASTGTPSLFLHPAEAIHGDLGRIVKGDAVLAISHSGDTGEILALVPQVKRLGSPLLAMTGRPRSALAAAADVHLDVSIREEACPLGLAPTASTTAALAMGDALAMALVERRGFTVDDFAVLHPGGHLRKNGLQSRRRHPVQQSPAGRWLKWKSGDAGRYRQHSDRQLRLQRRLLRGDVDEPGRVAHRAGRQQRPVPVRQRRVPDR